MDDGCIPKDILYAELTSGIRPIGCHQLRYKDVSKHDLKSLNIRPSKEGGPDDHLQWQQSLHNSMLKQKTTLGQHH